MSNESELESLTETPFIVLDYERLLKNIQDMSKKAKEKGVILRPHIKTHKCIEIAKLQVENGAVGLTCSKASEAMVFITHGGLKSITIAYPLVQIEKIRKLIKEASKTNTQLQFIIDSEFGAEVMNTVGKEFGQKIRVFIKIDVGLHRCGLEENDPRLISLVQQLEKEDSHVSLIGILSHAGHAYAKPNKSSIAQIAEEERAIMLRVKELILKHSKHLSANNFEVSVGSTPTVVAADNFEGITEIRPGNYVFMDRTQISKGYIQLDQISLFVVATVISFNSQYIIIDSGSKMLSSDLAPHSAEGIEGYGEAYYSNDWKTKSNKMILAKLSEEHGWIKREEGSPNPTIGSRIYIIPNHSCPTANLSSTYHVLFPNGEIKLWSISARGCVH